MSCGQRDECEEGSTELQLLGVTESGGIVTQTQAPGSLFLDFEPLQIPMFSNVNHPSRKE